ncbi:hypothetical protein [Candidatus Xianfuyuplasma coldseepsis]|uniref:Uncharacterized protein n=1 Tax=Candidatus Xianfuyuplasma coldseepsis TaxID=2782163 RepID=A0A7L7KSR1_9MOLU|nr:hypothetical protein [Xianfuyuplasma coldseepsis]QMS85747.1 hypothetical protein G4Z02_08320 [Xianfuyuplasma coldseepsis]
MTEEMSRLFGSLITIEVRDIRGAYDYLGNELNKMEQQGELSFDLTSNALKNINIEYKLLKKYYKGKIILNPEDCYKKFPENTEEHFFLKCLVTLMNYNQQ